MVKWAIEDFRRAECADKKDWEMKRGRMDWILHQYLKNALNFHPPYTQTILGFIPWSNISVQPLMWKVCDKRGWYPAIIQTSLHLANQLCFVKGSPTAIRSLVGKERCTCGYISIFSFVMPKYNDWFCRIIDSNVLGWASSPTQAQPGQGIGVGLGLAWDFKSPSHSPRPELTAILGGVGHCFAWHVQVHFSIEMTRWQLFPQLCQ